LTTQKTYVRKIEPRSIGWRSYAWSNGAFDTALRPYTEIVEGTICTPQHLVLVTLRGRAESLEVTSACGHRYVGADRPGAVSFVPAHCERRLRFLAVQTEWASISLSPALLDDEAPTGAGNARSLEGAIFTNGDDPFLAAVVGEFARLYAADGALDPTYCNAMSVALAQYLARRYGRPYLGQDLRSWKLPPWRLRRIADYVEARIDGDVEGEVRITDLASLVGVSPGHLHRAFRTTTGKTPLEFINERRVQRAMQILEKESASIAEIAFRIGFLSPSHFTRTFRRITGLNPSAYRRGGRDRL
jgi:AraC family transcriptional regulator